MAGEIPHLNQQELELLDHKTRSIIYKEKEQLRNVLRYNSGGTILPVGIDQELRDILNYMRDNNSDAEWIEIYKDDDVLVGKKGKKTWEFELNGKKLKELRSSGTTYSHTLRQGVFHYKYGKIDLAHGDIDYLQFKNDHIRNNIHDRSERITDDMTIHEKSNVFRIWENEVAKNLINEGENLSDNEKDYLKQLLHYKKDSRFKLYENLLCIYDAIEMRNNFEEYNEVNSILYEIIKFRIPDLLGDIQLDNGKQIPALSLTGVRMFLQDYKDEIDQILDHLIEHKDILFEEHRFTHLNYDVSDLNGKFDRLKAPWEIVKKTLS